MKRVNAVATHFLAGLLVAAGLSASANATELMLLNDITPSTPDGARVEVQRSAVPVRLARLSPAPFTTRLVSKFGLSVEGWRGGARYVPGGAP